MTMIVTILTLVLLIGTGIIWKKGNGNGLENQRKKDQEAPVEIPENDKDCHIRSYVVEGIRAGIVNRLGNSSGVLVDTSEIHSDLWITHGEAHAIILPFLQKGYFAYKDIVGYSGDKVTRFRIMKHRDQERNALEITEELLSTNAQL